MEHKANHTVQAIDKSIYGQQADVAFKVAPLCNMTDAMDILLTTYILQSISAVSPDGSIASQDKIFALTCRTGTGLELGASGEGYARKAYKSASPIKDVKVMLMSNCWYVALAASTVK